MCLGVSYFQRAVKCSFEVFYMCFCVLAFVFDMQIISLLRHRYRCRNTLLLISTVWPQCFECMVGPPLIIWFQFICEFAMVNVPVL